MRLGWRKKFDTGWGELLCFALAWAIGLAAVWMDYSHRPHQRPGDKVAASGGRAPSQGNFD
jgi:hypothetical protein